ncbi:DUF2312 domain-containing protein [Oceanibaculum nanhaiense]|uniref:DUF2312 domain-containing protein n=1 Tax=Oceanibaculum nanhaiense TaxID=1909734 RepID=UPI003D29924D
MPDIATSNVGGIAGERLRSFIERIERLEEEKAALAGDIREIFAEAKGTGFDTKIMRQVLKLRKLDREDRQEQETLLDLYLQALGMQGNLLDALEDGSVTVSVGASDSQEAA